MRYKTRVVVVEAEQYVQHHKLPANVYTKGGTAWLRMDGGDLQLRSTDWIVRITVKGVEIVNVVSDLEFKLLYREDV